MYKFHYEETTLDEASGRRQGEREAIEYGIALLEGARKAGRGSKEAIEALAFTNRLWGFFIEELCSPDCPAAPELRAKLISIGIWVLKEVDAITDERSDNFAGLIDIQKIIAEGLQ